MTRLFIRFYLGVLFILFAAWSIQAYVSRQEAANVRNIEVIEDALGGGVRISRFVLATTPESEWDQRMSDLQRAFNYPMAIVEADVLSEFAIGRLKSGRDIAYYGTPRGGFVVTKLANRDEFLRFGPLPGFTQPSQAKQLTALGLILLLAAGAIALLLRPVVRQLRLVERTATAIADGDFSARVDERQVKAARTLALAFNDMAAKTEAVLRTQQEMLQTVSHELRTPLSRIHFATDLIRTETNPAKREQRLESLENAAHELDQLVDELLRYVRLETSLQPMTKESVSLLSVVEDLVRKHSLTHPGKVFEIDEELKRGQMTVVADRHSLERALGNLISNAARFCRTRVVISAQSSPDGVVINVDDDGAGIAASERERIFQPFVRASESGHGVGLGLALVQRILAQHDGSVVAEKSALGGARFRSIWPGAGDQDQTEDSNRALVQTKSISQ